MLINDVSTNQHDPGVCCVGKGAICEISVLRLTLLWFDAWGGWKRQLLRRRGRATAALRGQRSLTAATKVTRCASTGEHGNRMPFLMKLDVATNVTRKTANDSQE